MAYEFRDCVYNETNRSMLSTTYGRTKEFKDRSDDNSEVTSASQHYMERHFFIPIA